VLFKSKIMKNKRLVVILGAVMLLLSIPFVAMQFTDDVNWSFFDFTIAGSLLLVTGLLGDLVFRKVTEVRYRIALSLAILAVLFLVWAELAVGIFGTPFAGS